jgi:hypothetical protein
MNNEYLARKDATKVVRKKRFPAEGSGLEEELKKDVPVSMRQKLAHSPEVEAHAKKCKQFDASTLRVGRGEVNPFTRSFEDRILEQDMDGNRRRPREPQKEQPKTEKSAPALEEHQQQHTGISQSHESGSLYGEEMVVTCNCGETFHASPPSEQRHDGVNDPFDLAHDTKYRSDSGGDVAGQTYIQQSFGQGGAQNYGSSGKKKHAGSTYN